MILLRRQSDALLDGQRLRIVDGRFRDAGGDEHDVDRRAGPFLGVGVQSEEDVGIGIGDAGEVAARVMDLPA